MSLELKNVSMRFGGLTAVGDLACLIGPRDLVGLIGPNGAGKTTVFNVITGVYSPTEGDVVFQGKSIKGLKSCDITAHGISRTFQNIRLFKGLSVFDNIRVSFAPKANHKALGSFLRAGSFYAEEKAIEHKIMSLLEFFRLSHLRDEHATSLPYGDQRRLEIIRALATDPKLLLLDEPAAGMNPTEKQDLMRLIRTLRDQFNIAILLIEHDMSLVMGVCERIMVLDYGIKIAEGTPEEIRHNPRVIEAYLGVEEKNSMLSIKDLHVSYGPIKAIKGISIEVPDKAIVTLIGANGAGKTTLLRTISGLIKAKSGSMTFAGKELCALPPHEVVKLGVAQSPEGRMIFSNLTVDENLKMGAYLRKDSDGIAKDLEYVFAIFPRLRERIAQAGGTLSGGEQQMLAIGRALMSQPKILLLDEPSLGIAPILVRTIFDKILEINANLGVTILLVEQNANMALAVAHKGYVLENGKIVLEGLAKDLAENEEVKKAYLGGH